MKTTRPWMQATLLSLVTIATTANSVFGFGRPNSPGTLLFGAKQFLLGLSPYVRPEGASYFKYSPFFAMLFVPFTWVSGPTASVLWAFLGIFVFWFGISLWFQFTKSTNRWLWFALVLASMEVDGNTRHLQTNPLLIGLILIGFWAYRERKFAGAATFLTVATSIKVFPGLFLATLFPERRLKFIGISVVVGIATLALPALYLGIDGALAMHQEWIAMLIRNSKPGGFEDTLTDSTKRMLHVGQVAEWYGVRPFGDALAKVILTSTVFLLAMASYRRIEDRWQWWIPMGLACALLVSPGTEAPTFCILAPAYLMLVARFSEGPNANRGKLYAVGLAICLITLVYNDIWPRFLWNPREYRSVSKMFGTLLIWILCFGEALALFRLSLPKREPLGI